MSEFFISVEKWQALERYFPPSKKTGRPSTCQRMVLSAICYLVKTGCQWRYLPGAYPPWQTVYCLYRKWMQLGIIENIINDLIPTEQLKEGYVDAMFVRAKNGGDLVGPTKCGKGTKLMVVVDKLRRFIGLSLDSARVHETRALSQKLIPELGNCPKNLIGDRAYDSWELHEDLGEQGIKLIAPHKRNRVSPPYQDGRNMRRYKNRWKIEAFFARLQTCKRTMIRYERNSENFKALVYLAIIFLQLK